MTASSDKSTYGGQKVQVMCPHCHYRLTLIDRQFMQYGPIRCGSCGAEVKESFAARVLEDAATAGPSRNR